MPRMMISRMIRVAIATAIAIGATGAALQMAQACPAIVDETVRTTIPIIGTSKLFRPSQLPLGIWGRIQRVQDRVRQVKTLAIWAVAILIGGWVLALREFVHVFLRTDRRVVKKHPEILIPTSGKG